jgi:hypothetical protein
MREDFQGICRGSEEDRVRVTFFNYWKQTRDDSSSLCSKVLLDGPVLYLHSSRFFNMAMHIKIRTPQQSFITNPKQWLGRSAYFENLFSGAWGDKAEDGSYFIETEARLFEHILRYLCTGVLPLFYDRVAGHDLPLYHALLEQSKYFGIDRLQRWLCEQKYLDAIKIEYIATETQDRESYRKHTTNDTNGHQFMVEDRFVDLIAKSNSKITIVPIKVQKNAFYCPNGKHGRSTEEYCRSCLRQAKDDGMVGLGGWKSVEQLRWCIVRETISYDHKLCTEAFLDDESQ